MITFISSPRFVDHDTGPVHPERPDRIRAIHRAVRAAGLVDSPDPFPEFALDLGPLSPSGFKVREVAPRPADEQWLATVHTPAHVEKVRHLCAVGGGVADLGDTVVSLHTWEIAMLSLGAVLTACDEVMTGRCLRAFAAGRPPGHHAEPDRAMGFCFFSNVAIGARYLQKQYGVQRVAIVDFDVHHGNGTQAAFEADPSVYFVSLHQHPRTCYPGSGYDWERGIGPGTGTTMNLPMPPLTDDDAYVDAIDARVIPALEEFRPEVLMISAGFDAHYDDPLANMALSEEGFERMTRSLVKFADRHCQGRVVSTLEGGYNLRALGRSVVRHLVALVQ
jgi:acetoin utilization deacetylase AcuC-like enzyme